MALSDSQSAGSAGSIQYEAFQPISELKEESIANILLVNLPGFQKEQIKVSYVHARRTINVHAEQKLSNGKWRRCYKTFSVPQNCKVFEIRGKFQNGTLTITMPKEIVTQQVLVPEPAAKIIFPKAKLEENTNSPIPPQVANFLSTDDRQTLEKPKQAKTDIPNAQSVQETNSPSFPKKQHDDFMKLPRQEKVTSPANKLSNLDRQAEKTLDNRKMIEKEVDEPKYEEKNKPNTLDQPAGKPKSENERK